MRSAFLIYACVVLAVAAAAVSREARSAAAAADAIALEVRPAVVPWAVSDVTARGAVTPPRRGEEVRIEAKDCGLTAFRQVAGATTTAAGSFSTELWIGISTVLRARTDTQTSNEVEVRRRPGVFIRQRSGRRFSVGAQALKDFEGRRMRVERWDARNGRWLLLRTVRLRRLGVGGVMVFSGAEFRMRVAGRTLLRAVLPTSQARPCYVAGVSPLIRTTAQR